MDERKEAVVDICRCPHCACCFCSEADLKRHLDALGESKAKHVDAFRGVHRRLEHGAFGYE
ncbi:MAG: hypothetical protein NWF04_04645 [Candidatus Bathyarchaeota archaeon]|nr:hypothetical protein [Candidatus Bathyarchaeota archaeon]